MGRKELRQEETEVVVGGVDEEVTGDVAKLEFSGKAVPAPPPKSRKPEDQSAAVPSISLPHVR